MELEFCNVGHRYGDVEALTDLNYSVSSGEIACLLGPSGCGKTTLLQLAAGLQDVQQGEIRLGGEMLASAGHNPPPEKRPIGLVFQEGALFPHMTVSQNVGFGISKQTDSAAIVSQWLDQVSLSDFGNRHPHMLSGGQQQRVALARAMAPEPAIFLMDEPFANIDVVLRRQLREDTRKLLRARGATAILVTHDPQEAMEIGDKVAVMEEGQIVQYGTPDEFFDAPATAEIGAMIGSGQVVSGTRNGDVIETAFGKWPVSCLKNRADHKRLDLLVHPSAIEIDPKGQGCSVLDIRRTPVGREVIVTAEGEEQITVEASKDDAFNRADQVGLNCKPAHILAFPSVD